MGELERIKDFMRGYANHLQQVEQFAMASTANLAANCLERLINFEQGLKAGDLSINNASDSTE